MEAARNWLPSVLGVLAFLWYALTAAPGFYWLDSAELSAGAVALGAAHPTGFPLYMVLAKLASLLPIGELAFRINLLSALCAAIAVAGLAKLILRLGRDDWSTLIGAAAGGLMLALSFLFARHATIAEVYAPTAAFLVVTLLLFEEVLQGATARVGLSLAWVAGLGLCMHSSFRLLMGIPILVLLSTRLYRGARWPLLAPVATTLCAGALYLYLPLRSATGRIASLDWGHPDNWARAWDHANAMHSSFDHRMLSSHWEVIRLDFREFGQQLGENLGLLGVLAAVVGLIVLVRERKTRRMAACLLTMGLLDAVYAGWIHPMGLMEQQNGVPFLLVACICAGVAVSSLGRLTGPAAPFVSMVACLVLVVPLASVSLPLLAGVGDLPRDVSEEGLLQAAPNAVVLSQSDSLAAGTLYLTSIEGARPDVAALVVSMLVDQERVAAQLLTSGGRHNDTSEGLKLAPLARILASGRPILWESGSTGLPRGKALQYGAVRSRVVDGPAAPVALRESLIRLRHVFSVRGRQERVARRVLANALTNAGRAAYGHEQMALAKVLFTSAIEIRPKHSAARVHLGVLYSRQGDLQAALQTTEAALLDEPNRQAALVHAARYRLAQGDLINAEKHATRALRLAPDAVSALLMAALVDMQQKRRRRARSRLERVLQLDPSHREARAALNSL